MELREGIILKTIKYQENSKIAYIITEEGLTTALIRASLEFKSKNFAYSQELTKIEFDIVKSKKNSFDILSSGRLIDSFLNIKKDYNKLLDVSSILDLTYKTTEHVTNNKNLYDLLDYYLKSYNENCNNNSVRFYNLIFRLKLLYLLGLGLNFTRCSVCNCEIDLQNNFFSIDRGGVVCNGCKHYASDLEHGDFLTITKILYLGKLDKLNHNLISQIPLEYYSEIDEFIKNYYSKYLSI